MYKKSISVLVSILIIWACTEPKKQIQEFDIEEDTIDFYYEDTVAIENDTIEIAEDSVQIEGLAISPEDVSLSEELLFDKYTLADEYPYKKKTRTFQWSKIKEYLAFVENFQNEDITYAVLQNYRNLNGMAPLVKNHTRNHYDNTIDSVGVERSQSIPLFEPDANTPSLYARDGSLVRLLSSDTTEMVEVDGISFNGMWSVPKRYVRTLGDTLRIRHIAFVDVTNQNIALVERVDDGWKIRSKNPATTGRNKPPYSRVTPTGIFMLQEKRSKMFYLKDGTTELEGFAPYASRFTNGAYIHGVPVADPEGEIVEYSYSLGTTPRSHMCVRNASSHAQFIYQNAKALQSLVIVID